MKLDIDVRGVKPAILSRLASDIEADGGPVNPVAGAVAAGIRACMQWGEPVSVDLPLTATSEKDLDSISNWAQCLRDPLARSPWPAIAGIFNGIMFAVRDEEELRKISERRRRREELFGDDDDDSKDDTEWSTL